MKIVIIDNFDSFTWNLYQQISLCMSELSYSNAVIEVIRNNAEELKNINEKNTSAIIIGPGPGRPEDCGYANIVFNEWQGRIPFLGVCLGHQLIAQFNGATVSKARIPMHGRTSQLKGVRGRLFQGIDSEVSEIQVARYHSLIVEDLGFPSKLTVTSYSEEGEVMSLEWEELKLFGIQFHPESFLTNFGDIIVKNFLKFALKDS